MALQSFHDIAAFKTKPYVAVLTDICDEPDDAESPLGSCCMRTNSKLTHLLLQLRSGSRLQLMSSRSIKLLTLILVLKRLWLFL